MTTLTATEVVVTITTVWAGHLVVCHPSDDSPWRHVVGDYHCLYPDDPYGPKARAAALADLNRKLMEGESA